MRCFHGGVYVDCGVVLIQDEMAQNKEISQPKVRHGSIAEEIEGLYQ
jgi:hypothetical protein